ncbi:O-phosphoseryl-tRNA(Sec) selenium transferase [Candidatus Bathyarchaeota archaeon]|nr:O-phosphoseryl-tRNA(Sec) selenium transferase [Candidatus Bathyarchaeota archaeon]
MSELEKLLKSTIPTGMLHRGLTALHSELKPIKILFEQRRVPDTGLDDELIEKLLTLFSSMDTDKDPLAARIGEREARVASKLVSRLSAGFNHGVGRSGDLVAFQPKAPGGSLLYYFANKLALDALQRLGVPNIHSAYVTPIATGMTLALILCAVRKKTRKREIVYPRVDHKSPLKGMEMVDMEAKIVDGTVFGDAVRIPIEDIEGAVGDKTAAIVSTTTFFPPREPDRIKEIAKLAKELNVFHVINNAYGIQSREITRMVRGAIDAGRVDAILQSTDKNFLTPIGGSIIASPDTEFLESVSQSYPGRATAAPIAQFLAAILSIGVQGYQKLRNTQESNRKVLGDRLQELANKHGERVLEVYNPIAAAMTITRRDAKKIGHHLYTLRVTGPRILEPTDFGVCCPKYPVSYITMNAAIGSTETEIEMAIQRLDKLLLVND